jgi:hypothetical protein
MILLTGCRPGEIFGSQGTDEDDEKNLACVSIAGHPVYAGPLNPGDDFDFAAQAKLLGTRVPDSHEFSRRMRLLLSAVSMHSASTTSTTSTITRSPKTPSPIPTPMHSILNN